MGVSSTNTETHNGKSRSIKKCSTCGGSTYNEKTKWGTYEHWYGTSDCPICKRCFNRSIWQKRFVPLDVKCDRCQGTETIRTKYGTSQWVKNREREGGYLCWSCYIVKRNTGKYFL
jgi:hypothetical protein